ncbi:MAG: hypothetical protein AAFX10_08625 [Pseudomonadota bacterium]
MQSAHLFVIVLVSLGLLFAAYQSRLKYRSSRNEAAENEDVEAMQARIDELEERIRVLEQIVTDPKEELSRKIGSL